MATRLLPPGYQVLNANGEPYPGALLYTYEAGTSTPKITFSDGGGTIANANPIVADSAGRFPNIFATVGDYRLVMQAASGVPIFTADPVEGSTSSATVPGTGFRNLLINGAFQVNQRRATSVADGVYCLDNWYVLTETGNVTVAQQTLQQDGIPANIRLLQPDATPKRMGLAQIVEASDCQFLRASAVTMSGMVRITGALYPVRYAILAWTGAADTVTRDVVLNWSSTSYTAGGFFLAADVTVQEVGTITPALGTWTAVPEITSTMTSALNNVIVFVWTETAVAQNATLAMSLLQAEQGTDATGFEYLPFDTQYERCARHYRKSFSLSTAPATGVEVAYALRFPQVVGASTIITGLSVRLSPPMRTNGYAVTLYNPVNANALMYNASIAADCGATSVTSAAAGQFTISTVSPAASAAGNALAIHFTADSSL